VTSSSLLALNANAKAANCITASDLNNPDTDLLNTQVRQAYGLNSLLNAGFTGKGITILLPEFAPYSSDDVGNYLSCVGYKGNFSTVTVNGLTPTGDPGEPNLDIEMIAGLAPYANIVVYQEANSGTAMQDVFAQIISDYAKHSGIVEMSVSWGLGEQLSSTGQLNGTNTQLRTLAQAEHITTFSASGDCAAYDDGSYGYPDTLDINFPASSPYDVAVGGTQLTVNGQFNRGSEVVWQGNKTNPPDCQNSWGSGGGVSTYFAKGSYQTGVTGIQNKYSTGKREVPDIAAAAVNLVDY
jgi:kumamolisin